MRELLGLDRVIFMVAAVPPHKFGMNTDFSLRFRLTSLAVEGHPGFVCSDLESTLPGKSYSVQTLDRLHREYPTGEARLFFVVGADSFLELRTWKAYDELPELASLVVVRRPGFSPERVETFLKETFPGYVETEGTFEYRHPSLQPMYLPPSTRLDISSTLIRNLVCQGKSIRYLLPEAVRKTIEDRGLYLQ